MNNKIDSVFKKHKITEWGFVKARVFSERLGVLGKNVPFVSATAEERINPFAIMEDARSVIVFLLPYKASDKKTNLSEYAKGEDYHIVAKRISDDVIEVLHKNGFDGIGFCDNGTLDDRYLAYLAGLGIYGKNGLIINDKYGTYTFIGYIVTNMDCDEGKAKSGMCTGCDKCIKSCPGGAVSDDGIDYDLCVSYLTQKKGELSDEEESIIKKSGYVWGCDICQSVCPMNKNTKNTEIYAFIHDTVEEITDEGLSNREFMNKYHNRAFSWRGAGIIRRNVKISRK